MARPPSPWRWWTTADVMTFPPPMQQLSSYCLHAPHSSWCHPIFGNNGRRVPSEFLIVSVENLSSWSDMGHGMKFNDGMFFFKWCLYVFLVCDPSTFIPWQDEINKFLPSGSFRVIAAADGGQLRRFSLEALQMADVVIVPYPIFRGRSYANLKLDKVSVMFFFPLIERESVVDALVPSGTPCLGIQESLQVWRGDLIRAGNNANDFKRSSFDDSGIPEKILYINI